MLVVVLFSAVTMVPAQRSPYLGSSDPGVLPQYLPQGTEDRFGGSAAAASKPEEHSPPPLHSGTLETEDVYNRVSEWPDQHKPFWYLNAVAIQKQVRYYNINCLYQKFGLLLVVALVGRHTQRFRIFTQFIC